jgi:phosphatidylglycerophosphate synthase
MKPRGMDGPVDLLLYRPIGFVVAWALSFTKASPNAVTAFSALFGLAAGIIAQRGTATAFLLCGLLFQVSNCLDCADGQLARLTGRQSPEGRILDGFADYAVYIFVYSGVMLGLLNSGHAHLVVLALFFAGGLATAFCNMQYDRAISRYSEVLQGGAKGGETEFERARDIATRSRGAKRIFWLAYSRYARLAGGSGPRAAQGETGPYYKRDYVEAMLPLLNAWSFTGPSAHVLYFLIFAAIGKPEWYFAACVVLAQATVILLAAQRLVDFKLYRRLVED